MADADDQDALPDAAAGGVGGRCWTTTPGRTLAWAKAVAEADALDDPPHGLNRAAAILAHLLAGQPHLAVARPRVGRAGRTFGRRPGRPRSQRTCGRSAAPGPTCSTAATRTRSSPTATRAAANTATPIGEVVLHVVTHGSYHRGQLGLLLGRSNLATPNTDLVHAARTGRLSEFASAG